MSIDVPTMLHLIAYARAAGAKDIDTATDWANQAYTAAYGDFKGACREIDYLAWLLLES